MIGIYKITSPSNRVYIGQSIDIEKRLMYYKNGHSKQQVRLFNSLKKYGFSNHKFEVLCECETSELNEKERYFQDLFNCVETGLNCKLTKSIDRKGSLSKETKLKMSIIRKGKKQSSETCLKKSKNMTGNKNPMFGKFGELNPFFGKKHTKESLNKMSPFKKGHKICLGRILSNETKNKMGVSKRKKVINTDTNEIHISAKSLSKEIGMNYNTLRNQLNGSHENKTKYKYYENN